MDYTRPAYFIGFALPQELDQVVSMLKKKLHDDIDHSLKPLVPHITLLHPSSLRSAPPSEILPEVRRIATEYLPLTLSLETIEAFDRTVLYIRVHSPEVEQLQSKLVSLLPVEDQEVYHNRPYVPHVTLAQVRAPHSLDIEALRRQVNQEIALPCHITVGSVSCFTQTEPRQYFSSTI